MPVEPGYGETPISDDEADALVPGVRALLGDPPSKAEIYDLEQTIQDEVAAELLSRILSDELSSTELTVDSFVRDLHRMLYADIWTWGGAFRVREVTIGVAPEQIAVQLRSTLEDIQYRWEHTDDWTPQQLAMAVHAETVRIHPFVDGNGRTTRLLGDLVLAAAQVAQGGDVLLFDWDVDKRTYVGLLRDFDRNRDPAPLADLVRAQRVIG